MSGVATAFDLVLFPVIGGLTGMLLGGLLFGNVGAFLGFFIGGISVLGVTTRRSGGKEDGAEMEQRIRELERENARLRAELDDDRER